MAARVAKYEELSAASPFLSIVLTGTTRTPSTVCARQSAASPVMTSAPERS